MILQKKYIKNAYENFNKLNSTDKSIFIITIIAASLSFLSYFTLHITLLAILGIFIHTWIILAKLKNGDLSLKKTSTSTNELHDFNINLPTILISFIGLSSSLAIALNKNTLHTDDTNQLLSLAGIILAIVTGYYLWTLDRTEKEGRLTIEKLKENIRKLERAEKTIFMNNELINYLFNLHTFSQISIIFALKNKNTYYLTNTKKILNEVNKITHFCLEASMLSNNPKESHLTIDSLSLLYKESIHPLIKNEKLEDDILIEIKNITPMLQATANYLNSIEGNQKAQVLAKLIDLDLAQRSTNARSIT